MSKGPAKRRFGPAIAAAVAALVLLGIAARLRTREAGPMSQAAAAALVATGDVSALRTPAKLRSFLGSVLHSHSLYLAVAREIPSRLLRRQPVLAETFQSWAYSVQKPGSGFWGERPLGADASGQADDLPITLAMLTALRGNISNWDQVAETAGRVSRSRYGADNLRLLELYRLGWSRLSPAAKSRAGAEIARRLQWTLHSSLQPDGSFRTGPGRPLETAEDQGVSFLAQAGYFNRSLRFWTTEEFPEADAVRLRITAFLAAQSNRGGSSALFQRDLTEIAPNPADKVQVLEDVAYLPPGRSEKLDLYLPPRSSGSPSAPAVIWAHGNQGDKRESRELNVCQTLSGAGYVCASINYGPWTGGQPFAVLRRNLNDAKNAVQFLRAHANEFHLDPRRIAFFGGSAGANLSVLVGVTGDDPQFRPDGPYPGVSDAVQAVGDFYGTSDFRGFALRARGLQRLLAALLSSQIRRYSAVTHITAKTPPMFIAHGRDDPLEPFDQSVELDRILTQD
ncbi:MAG TPA: alpha/beta hydrolase, partial [Opitutaceae bacterium]|nr:alpha/beta hydrolase [Opitutaceae bacterium]